MLGLLAMDLIEGAILFDSPGVGVPSVPSNMFPPQLVVLCVCMGGGCICLPIWFAAPSIFHVDLAGILIPIGADMSCLCSVVVFLF